MNSVRFVSVFRSMVERISFSFRSSNNVGVVSGSCFSVIMSDNINNYNTRRSE